jgi:hypothetical protein
MYGWMEYVVKFKSATQVSCTMPGKITLELPEGTKYEMVNAECLIEGLINSSKNLNIVGELEVRDMTNMMVARTVFDANSKKRKSGMMARWVTGTDKKNKDGVMENRRDLIKMEVI